MANKGVKPEVPRQIIADFYQENVRMGNSTFEHFKLMGYKKMQVHVALKRVDARQLAERKKGQVDQGDILRLFRSIKVNIQISTNEGSWASFH